jgi:hypothetical protein
MKECTRNKKALALLALTEGEGESELRIHLEGCEGCQRYYQEMREIYLSRTAIKEMPHQFDFSLHHRVMAKLRESDRRKERWSVKTGLIRFGVAAGIALLLVAALLQGRRESPKPRVQATASIPENLKQGERSSLGDFAPTMAEYRKKAGNSFENLDRLLNEQGSKNNPELEPLTISSLLE